MNYFKNFCMILWEVNRLTALDSVMLYLYIQIWKYQGTTETAGTISIRCITLWGGDTLKSRHHVCFQEGCIFNIVLCSWSHLT